MLPGACAAFARRYPKTPLTVAVDNARGVETMLLENRVDIGLIEGAVKNEQLEKQLLASYPICLACLPELENQPESLEELIHSRLLLREKGSAVRDVFDSALLLSGLAADPVWESVNSQALVDVYKRQRPHPRNRPRKGYPCRSFPEPDPSGGRGTFLG